MLSLETYDPAIPARCALDPNLIKRLWIWAESGLDPQNHQISGWSIAPKYCLEIFPFNVH